MWILDLATMRLRTAAAWKTLSASASACSASRRRGDSYVFAKNNTNLTADDIARAGKTVPPGDYRGREFAGACFDARGDVMFVNMQSPGITYAIWGPWARGNL